jgi:hypothetical protein
MIQKFIRSRTLLVLLGAAISMPVVAAPEDEPGAGAMVTDALVARPLGIVFTAVGTAAFIVSLPFTALGGGMSQAADKLVVGPAKETFVRCLGCPTGRYSDPDAASN